MMTALRRLLDAVAISAGMANVLRIAVRMQTAPSPQQLASSGNPQPIYPQTEHPSPKPEPLKSATPAEHKGFPDSRRSYSTPAIASGNGLRTKNANHGTPPSLEEPTSEPGLMNNSDPEGITAEPNSEGRPAALRASRVPSSRLGRLFHYGGLAAGIGWGTASEALRRTTSGCLDNGQSIVLSEPNVRRLVDKLTKMRGAALKLGQFMSIQDAKILPPQIEEIFAKVQSTADYMPFSQTEEVLRKELGAQWRERFASFTEVPIAAASIGQVHAATLVPEPGAEPVKVAVKVQFPGVYESIQSDLSYLSILASTSAFLPKGLFLSKTLEVLGQELKDECDYMREAWCGEMMADFLRDDPRFRVPKIFKELSSRMVLTTEFMSGTSLRHAQKWPQSLRNKIGHDILELCFREILHFRLMQTDPNWSNFLWNENTQNIELIDFGATREYTEGFVNDYVGLLKSGINESRDECTEASRKIGYLTGEESSEMVNSQFKTLRALGEPFRSTTKQPYDFSQETVTDRVRAEISTMVRLRLKPPPIETYSLNRKLSGMFLLCSRLKSQIDCFRLLENMLAEKETGSWGARLAGSDPDRSN